MILKKFFGKTIEVAKKSARQMYGDDIVILESFNPDGNNDAGVTVLVDGSAARKNTDRKKDSEEKRFRNVFYKRSDVAANARRFQEKKDGTGAAPPEAVPQSTDSKYPASASHELAGREPSNGQNRFGGNVPPQKISNNLKALRRFAREELTSTGGNGQTKRASEYDHPGEFASSHGSRNGRNKKTRFQPGAGKRGFRSMPEDEGDRSGFTNGILSRELQPEENGQQPDEPAEHSFEFTEQPSFNGENGNSSMHVSTGKPVRKSRFQPSNPDDIPSRETGTSPARGQREVSALHKRFDKLETLLDSALISSNLDYASHPAFQQLLQTGIKPTVIARWFREIIETGIDPEEEPNQFMSHLSTILRNALKSESNEPPEQFMLFAGPSGSGKTHLIMKLLLHPEFIMDKRAAVVSLEPLGQENLPYYTILRPFCEDHNIPYYTIRDASDVKKHRHSWQEFDHVLIDSPSIPVEQESSFRQYWKMRQMLSPLTSLEVHYVVNASLNRYYFRNSGKMHHPLQPDFVAVTHLDEVSEWGPVIPFLEEMGCGARYISMGSSIPDSLSEFSPAWFAQQVLQDS